MIKKIDSALQPFVSFPSAVKFKKANVVFAPSFTIYPLIKVNIASLAKKLAIKNFYKKIDKVHIFTKQKNINKLYVDSNNGLFLSPGIVLRFINLDKSRFLKKRLRTWYGYIKALQLLQRKPFVLFFKDLNGKKTILLNKIRVSGVKVAWLLIKLFKNNHVLKVKSARRIKRWIRKKYYQIEVGERG